MLLQRNSAYYLKSIEGFIVYLFSYFNSQNRDSYWVIKGLLLCQMKSTVKGMLENFLSLVEEYGFVPNGGRIYYTRRSQPPFLALMVDEYYKATGKINVLNLLLPLVILFLYTFRKFAVLTLYIPNWKN